MAITMRMLARIFFLYINRGFCILLHTGLKIRGVVAWMFFLGLSFKSHWRLPIPKQNRGWLLYFYHSCFNFFFYAPNCRNLPELAFACYVVFEKKSWPYSECENLWTHLLFDDYNLGHGE